MKSKKKARRRLVKTAMKWAKVCTHDPDNIGDMDEELPGPLQRRTAMGLVRSGKLRARKIGQHWYTTRRHLAALVDEDAAESATIDPDAILRGHIQRRRR